VLLRTIIGTDMRDGMRRVREQLGDDAIIVQVEDLEGGGVMLLAAADGSVPVAQPPAASAPPPERPAKRPGLTKPQFPPAPKPAAEPAMAPAPPPRMGAERILDRVAEALSFHRVAPPIAEALIDAVEAGDWSDPQQALAGALGSALGFSDTPPPAIAAPMLLVGSAGTGKTVTLAKLAAEAVIAGRRIGIVSADIGRAGGLAQINTFAEALGTDVLQAVGPRDIQDAMIALGGCEAVFVDTPAATPFVPEDVADIVKLARAARGQIVPVFAAGNDPLESAEAAAVWREAGAARCIVTRTDTARRLGGLLAVAAAGLVVSDIGVSRAIAHGLAAATPARVAEMLLAAPGVPSTQKRSVR
jgi:flagellar biosynthesis protein FlhF